MKSCLVIFVSVCGIFSRNCGKLGVDPESSMRNWKNKTKKQLLLFSECSYVIIVLGRISHLFIGKFRKPLNSLIHTIGLFDHSPGKFI